MVFGIKTLTKNTSTITHQEKFSLWSMTSKLKEMPSQKMDYILGESVHALTVHIIICAWLWFLLR